MFFVFLLCAFASGYSQINVDQFPKPTAAQLAWQEAELGVLISYDLPVFQGKPYNQSQNRITPIADANTFNPVNLDTDQWIKAAKSAGARFAVLTVTHETGFALYQSDVNPYCMKAIRYKDGKGDIVRDFVNSCRKYDIQPGLYVGIRWNSYWGVYDFKVQGSGAFAANRQQYYKKMCEEMVRELCTRYGKLFMLWFDGGADGPDNLGPNVLPIVKQYQPDCLFYHNNQRADFRWGGSESGTVPYPCWSTYPFPFSHAARQDTVFANDFKLLKNGSADGKYWMPAMSDAPLRSANGGHDWFWNPNEDHHVNSIANLKRMYYQSVGHNSTLIIGLTPDNRGLIPDKDVTRLKEWGDSIQKDFREPIAEWNENDDKWIVSIPKDKKISRVVIQEKIKDGECVRAFVIETKQNGKWKNIAEGTCIGHKFIKSFEHPLNVNSIRLKIISATGDALIKRFSVY